MCPILGHPLFAQTGNVQQIPDHLKKEKCNQAITSYSGKKITIVYNTGI